MSDTNVLFNEKRDQFYSINTTKKISLELKIHTCYYIYTKGATDRRLDPI